MVTSKHPEESRISAFLHGELNRLESMKLEQHIDSCEQCQQLIEELISAQATVLPELSDEELRLNTEQKNLVLAMAAETKVHPVARKAPLHLFYKVAATFTALFIITYTVYRSGGNNQAYDNSTSLAKHNFDITTQIDDSSLDKRYIISIASNKPSPANHQPQSLTVVLDTSGVYTKQSGFKLLENHLAGIMYRVTEKDRLTVIINGASTDLQEVQLVGLAGKEAVNTILEVRLSARPELIDSIDYGYQYAAKTYSNEADNSVILLSSTNKVKNSIKESLPAQTDRPISFSIVKMNKSGQLAD